MDSHKYQYKYKGRSARTGIGITEDGKELLIATIDGRHTSYKGLARKYLEQFLKI